MPRPPLLPFALAAALALAGCGNKGPLVMPDQQPKKSKHAPAPAPAPPDATKPATSDGDAGH
jgi:diaminopimelate decarboxylase